MGDDAEGRQASRKSKLVKNHTTQHHHQNFSEFDLRVSSMGDISFIVNPTTSFPIHDIVRVSQGEHNRFTEECAPSCPHPTRPVGHRRASPAPRMKPPSAGGSDLPELTVREYWSLLAELFCYSKPFFFMCQGQHL